MTFDRPLCKATNCLHFAIQGSDYCSMHAGTLEMCRLNERVSSLDRKRSQKRPTWDETWLACADTMAKRSRCCRAQVGAVIVAEDQTVISMSYNGPPRDLPTGEGDCSNWCPRAKTDSPDPTYDDCVTAHAEANAIARADYSRMQGATIFVSTSCCKGCAKLLANSGIVRVVFRRDTGREYRKPQETIDFLRECGIEVDEV